MFKKSLPESIHVCSFRFLTCHLHLKFLPAPLLIGLMFPWSLMRPLVFLGKALMARMSMLLQHGKVCGILCLDFSLFALLVVVLVLQCMSQYPRESMSTELAMRTLDFLEFCLDGLS